MIDLARSQSTRTGCAMGDPTSQSLSQPEAEISDLLHELLRHGVRDLIAKVERNLSRCIIFF